MNEYEIDLELLKQTIHDKPNLAIHCDENEKAIALLKSLDSLGYFWSSGIKLTSTTCWDARKDKTCYVIGAMRITYTYTGSLSASSLDIVEFDDIVEPEKTLSAESFLNFLGGQLWANTI